jgi:hypothetical protein
MHNIYLPPTLIISFLLALAALLLNNLSPGAAAVVGAIAAIVFLRLLIDAMGR